MRTIIVALLSSLVVVAVAAEDPPHRTARAEVAVAAELEILPRSADLLVVPALVEDLWITLEPEVETATAMRSATAQALAPGSDIDDPEPIFFNTLYARASASSLASDDFASAEGRANPLVDLLNFTDGPLLARLLVRIPGRFPGEAADSPFFDRGSVDDDEAEHARVWQAVSIIPDWAIDDSEIMWPLNISRETERPTGTFPSFPDAFEHFGVAYETEYRIAVPTNFVDRGDVVEVHFRGITLDVVASTRTASILGGGSSEAVIAPRPLCELAPPRRIQDLRPHASPLCRAGRANARRPPFCDCEVEISFGKRCTFLFADFVVAQQLPPPVTPGQMVEVEWTIHPSVDGEFWFEPQIVADNKFVSLPAKEKAKGKLTAGKEASVKVAFAMPSRPTLLRTRMFHLPKGAKKPIESQIDTMVPMRKLKPQERP